MRILSRKCMLAVASAFALGASAQYVPNVVVEEATGEWCGWCPRGIVAIEQMLEQHPDGTFIPIAVHSGDEFEIPHYIGSLKTSGFPGCQINRIIENMSVNYNIFNNYYNEIRQMNVVGKIAIKPKLSANGSLVEVATTSTFGTASSKTYSIAIVLTESDVEGAYQANNYAGGGNGPMGGFESMKSSIRGFHFDHVARSIYPSYEGALLTNRVSEGQVIEKTYSVPMPTSIVEESNVTVVALLLEDGKIINATSAPLTDLEAAIPECDSFDVSATMRYSNLGVQTTAVFDNPSSTSVYSFVRCCLSDGSKQYFSEPNKISIEPGCEYVWKHVNDIDGITPGSYSVALQAATSVDGDYTTLATVDDVELIEAPEYFNISLASVSINDGSTSNVPANRVNIRFELKCTEGVFACPLHIQVYPNEHNSSANYTNYDIENVLVTDTEVFDVTLNLESKAFYNELYIVNVYYINPRNGFYEFLVVGKEFYLGQPQPSSQPVDVEQTIAWTQEIAPLNVGEQVQLDAFASSGLGIKYYVTKGKEKGTVEGNVFTAVAPGNVYVTAMQPGNDKYSAAIPVTMCIGVLDENGINPDNGSEGITDAAASSAPVEYYNLQGVPVTHPANGIFIEKRGTRTRIIKR